MKIPGFAYAEFVGRYIFGHSLITMLVVLPPRLDLASGFFEL
jgi:hypothetical protein